MDPQVYVFGYRNRYRSEEGEVARGKTSPATDGDQGVTGQASMYERELLSLIGQLQHACCVVRPGRTFLRRMINLSTVAKELHHRIRLNLGFRSDLQWWATFLPSWIGVGIMRGGVARRLWGDHDVGCLRILGLWGLHIGRGVVPAAVAGFVGRRPHHGERAPTNSDGSSHVGCAVAG